MVRPGSLSLKLPLPAKARARAFFENEADSLQEFVSTVIRRAWRAENASPHVSVDHDEIHVWYGLRRRRKCRASLATVRSCRTRPVIGPLDIDRTFDYRDPPPHGPSAR